MDDAAGAWNQGHAASSAAGEAAGTQKAEARRVAPWEATQELPLGPALVRWGPAGARRRRTTTKTDSLRSGSEVRGPCSRRPLAKDLGRLVSAEPRSGSGRERRSGEALAPPRLILRSGAW